MKHSKFFLLILCCWGVLGGAAVLDAKPPEVGAEPWPVRPEAGAGDLLNLDLRVYIAAKPIYCVLVEKDRQRLRVLRHDGRLQVVAEYAAATGENSGRKAEEGDSKTPEGVYFITKAYQDRKVSVFGTRAFHLNYPNYFDLREGRTGYGIFIHGTNKALRSNSSNGCVTLRNSDLDRLAEFLPVGTPVLIVPSLGSLSGEKGAYPNLSERNFAAAKALLIPGDNAQADFASLYLVRIKGQTVVVGEYWPDQGSAQSPPGSDGGAAQSPADGDQAQVPLQLSVAYLQGSADNQWTVVDRGPTASGPQEEKAPTIAGLPPDLGWPLTETSGGEDLWPSADARSWQVTQEDLYLLWYRQSNQPVVVEAQAVAPEPVSGPVLPAVNAVRGEGVGQQYAIFFIATCLSIGAAVLLIRRQIRRSRFDSRRGAASSNSAVEDGDQGLEQLALLRDEFKQVVETLHTVQERIDEEARNVESLEDLQVRMNVLEGTFQQKQAAIDQLHAEQVSLRAQGLAERQDQAAAPSVLQQELVEVTERLDEARQAMLVVADREGLVHGQLAELKRLAEREAVPQKAQELGEVVSVCEGIRAQVQAMAEALAAGELSLRQERGESSRGVAEVAEALQAYGAELKRLHLEMAEMRAVTMNSGFEEVVRGLRDELRAEQTTKLEMMRQLGRMTLLEEELTARHRENDALRARSEEVEALRQAGEARFVQAEAEKVELESAVQALRQELSAEQLAKSELTAHLGRIDELEADVAGREQEIEALRQGWAARSTQAEAEKVELESAVQVLRQELSTEQLAKSELTARLGRIDELEDELAGRVQEIERFRQERGEQVQAAAAEKTRLDLALVSLQNELREEQRLKLELTGRLHRISDLEEELASRNREVGALQEENEERQLALAMEKRQLESALESVRQELQEERSSRAELLSRLGRITELEGELAARDHEIEALREAQESTAAALLADKSRLEASLAEIVLARQVEVTSLSSALQEAKDKAEAEHESALSLGAQVETLQEALRAEREQQSQEQESTIADLRQEVETLQAKLVGLEKKASLTDGVVMVKGSHYLPGDVLRKWIGKE